MNSIKTKIIILSLTIILILVGCTSKPENDTPTEQRTEQPAEQSSEHITEQPSEPIQEIPMTPKKVYVVNDEFDELRVRAISYLTGGKDYDLSDRRVQTQIINLGAAAHNAWDSMIKPPTDALFPRLTDNQNFSQARDAFRNLAVMSLAYATYGCFLYQNEDLRSDIIMGLDWMYENRYGPSFRHRADDDWWSKEIAAPLQLGYVLMIMGEYLNDEQIANWVTSYHHYNPNGYDFSARGWGLTTGANRVDKCTIMMMIAILSKDDELMNVALRGLDQEFVYSEGFRPGIGMADGFYADGTFIQHVGNLYNTGYGVALLECLPYLLYILNGSSYAFSDADIQRICDWIYDSYIPVVYRGAAFDMAKGREIARGHLQAHTMGQRIASAVYGVSMGVPEPYASYFKSIAKGWTLDSIHDFFSETHSENQRFFPAAAFRMANLMDDDAIAPIHGYETGRMFAVGAAAVSHNTGYAFGVTMNSSRNKLYTALWGENVKGWYTNEGMTYFYTPSDPSHYDGDYWATVDFYRLPGTTVDTRQRDGECGNSTHSDAHWCGGVLLDDRYITTGYQLSAYGASLTAKKSWFMLDGKIVSLGTDINSTDNRTIETIIENRRLHRDANGDISDLTVDGTAVEVTNSWSQSFADVKTFHYSTLTTSGVGSMGGFYFPSGASINAIGETRHGNWGAIGMNTYGGVNEFLTIWIDHGQNPVNAGYEWIFLPNATAEETQRYAQNPDIIILENTDKAQAIHDTTANIIGVNFWSANGHTVGGVSSDKESSFMMITDTHSTRIAVSDPTWQNVGEITFEVDRAFGAVVSADEGIAVVQTSPRLVFTLNTNGLETMGKTFVLEVGN
jgi:hyaluronate lyase